MSNHKFRLFLRTRPFFLFFFLRECILFQMSLFWVKNFIKVRRKRLCSTNSDSGKLFQKLFPLKQSPGKEKNEKKSEGRGVERKRKGKVKTAVWLLNPKTIGKFCFLRMPKIGKKDRGRHRDGFCGKLFSFYMFLNQKMAGRASKPDFRRNSQGRMG